MIKHVLVGLLALVLGFGAGWLYFSMQDLMILALLLLIAALALGATLPERPWLSAILIAVAVVIAAFVFRHAGTPVPSGRIGSACAASLASGILGAYAGALMRKMIARVFGQGSVL